MFETAALGLVIVLLLLCELTYEPPVLRKGPKRPLREKPTLMQCQSVWDVEKVIFTVPHPIHPSKLFTRN